MTTLQQKHYDQISKKCKVCLLASLSLVVSLSLVKMVFSNRASTWGSDLNKIKLETENIRKENLVLRSKLAKESGGLNKLAEEAEEKGFTAKLNYKHFTKGQKVAQNLP
ncbi:MAG: hypothetical protein ABIJ43_03925 [Candidatus Beckwithbacteria bacterium]|nr:hypothetical protein [Patescibacteria group bacterium]